MKFTLPTIALLFACATSVVARPANPHQLSKRADSFDSTETLLLNYALALEHLENAFYIGALRRFNQGAFAAAGYNPFARGRFVQIQEHEQAHVELLSQALGANATKPCNYTFPYNNVQSFAALSQLLEGVGTSAYIGALKNITAPDFVSVAASILSTEARHAAWVAAVPNKFAPWSGPFDTALTPNQTFTLAKSFIVDCPAENPPLNLNAFPTLNVSRGFPGTNVTFTFDSSLANSAASNSGGGNGTQLYAVFFTGLVKEFVPLVGRDGSPLIVGGSSSGGGGNSTTASPTSTTQSIVTVTNSSSTMSPTSAASSTTSAETSANSTATSSDTSSATSTSSSASSTTTSVPASSTTAGASTPSSSVLTGTATVPQGIKGQVYAIVASNGTVATDDTTVAGPAVLIYEFGSNGNITRQSSP
ncbi:ferritin-like domain-containing protein [Collybia nuda]|uniref:Ferritin-like domain-containing protein n=1 Tax=Collybia nuda TaxID=64659 RepID=A0A9P5Y418_9AGAR|nr:ferritin-like domain-containing protein [Collybia nuda]